MRTDSFPRTLKVYCGQIASRGHSVFIADSLLRTLKAYCRLPADTQCLLQTDSFPRSLKAYCGQLKLLPGTQNILRTDAFRDSVPVGFSSRSRKSFVLQTVSWAWATVETGCPQTVLSQEHGLWY
jgi:hypothetical protein